MGDPEAFPDQMEYIIPPAGSGSAWRTQGAPLPGGHVPFTVGFQKCYKEHWSSLKYHTLHIVCLSNWDSDFHFFPKERNKKWEDMP